MNPRACLIAAWFAVLSGCAAVRTSSFSRCTGTELAAAGTTYPVTFAAPPGWVCAWDEEDHVLLTREGLGLQQIRVGVSATGSESGGPTRPEAFFDGLEGKLFSCPAGLAKDVRAIAVDGRPAVRLDLAGCTQNGLHRRGALVFVLTEGAHSIIAVRFLAPARHYFERDLVAFDALVASIRFSEPAVAPKRTADR